LNGFTLGCEVGFSEKTIVGHPKKGDEGMSFGKRILQSDERPDHSSRAGLLGRLFSLGNKEEMGAGSEVPGPVILRSTGYDILRLALGILLLVTAGLKGYQLATEPTADTGLLDNRWFLIFVVEFELFFGLWLLSGLLPRLTWAASVACFALFTCISLYKALSGQATCGCFGKIEVNPWLTASFDFFIVLSLLYFRPTSQDPFFRIDIKQLRGRALVVLGIGFLFGVPAALSMGTYMPSTLSDAGSIIGNGKIVVLEPEKWSGKRFPLFDYIDIGDKLKEGEWLVLLYHHDCPKCQDVISDLVSGKFWEKGRVVQNQIALIEMPPFGDSNVVSQNTQFTSGRLNTANDWFAETPVLLFLNKGVVVGRGEGGEGREKREDGNIAGHP
jgi:uncharacterized membrane protein YphA (DoxX/SURF4 family)